MAGSFDLTNPYFQPNNEPSQKCSRGYTAELSPFAESNLFPVTVGPVPNTFFFTPEGFSTCCFDVIVQNLFSP